MSRLAWAVFVLLVVGGVGVASAQSQINPLPPKAELRQDVQLTPVQPTGVPSQVPEADRLPFYCVLDRARTAAGSPAAPIEVWLSVRSEQPIKTENLHVHVKVPLVDGWNFKVATKNFALYPRWTWIYSPGSLLPANYNLPPEGQPLLRCEAFGWYPKQ